MTEAPRGGVSEGGEFVEIVNGLRAPPWKREHGREMER